ncbi:MAG TPA: hypothetical protein VMR81_04665 [Patescibacteria group bacterium]|jgi:hypothetical protein|nr:hypothetical protein [Patescibacteria group bacterium]
MSPDELREQVELEVVEFIKAKLATFEINETRAQQIANRVLDILKPGMSFEQLYKAIPSLDDTMPELAIIVLPHIRQYEENVTGQALSAVRDLIKQGQYDAAAKLGKKASTNDVELEWQGSGKPDESAPSNN